MDDVMKKSKSSKKVRRVQAALTKPGFSKPGC